jgi:hypothetical protein
MTAGMQRPLIALLALAACEKQTPPPDPYDDVFILLQRAAQAARCEDVQAALVRARLAVEAAKPRPHLDLAPVPSHRASFNQRYHEASSAVAEALERCHLGPLNLFGGTS